MPKRGGVNFVLVTSIDDLQRDLPFNGSGLFGRKRGWRGSMAISSKPTSGPRCRRAAKSRARPTGGITSELTVSQRNRKT
jgi:hypothetical protein